MYEAARPELFFKATPNRVRGHGQPVRIRRTRDWNVPEPELTLMHQRVRDDVGYTIGNDMSSRDIEGENPLYLPGQGLRRQLRAGPWPARLADPLPPETRSARHPPRRPGGLRGRDHAGVPEADPRELVEYLYRDNSFPTGALMLTGTGVVPPDEFTLAGGDEITIAPSARRTSWHSVPRAPGSAAVRPGPDGSASP